MKYKLKNKYIAGVLMAIIVLSVNQIFIQFWLNKKQENAKIVKLSTQQTLLSQKLCLELIKALNTPNSYSKLQITYNELKNTHHSLLNGDEKLGISAIENAEARALLLKLSVKIEQISLFLKPNQERALEEILSFNESQYTFQEQMNKVVEILEDESESQFQFVVITEVLLALLSVFIIGAEVIYVYQPIEKELLQTISKLESSESKLLAILDSTTDSNIFISPDFKIVNFNKSAEADFEKYHNIKPKVGDDFRPFILSNIREPFYAFFKDALEGKITVKEVEIVANGESAWFKIRFFPVYDSHSRIIGVTFNATSIDEAKKAEIKSNEQVALLRKIAWDQSHLVRNPVSNILGFTKMILDQDYYITQEERNAFIEQLGEEAQKLDKVVKEIVKEAYYVYNK